MLRPLGKLLFSITNQGFPNISDQSKTLTLDRRKVTELVNKQEIVHGEGDNFGDTGKIVTTLDSAHSGPKNMISPELQLYHELSTGTIEDFLSRPKLLSSGSLSSTDTANTFAPIDVITNVYTLFAPKLQGHFAARFDLKIRLDVSADKFHIGRYILAYLPAFNTINTAPPYTTWSISHATNKVQLTQLPHVEIDVATEKSATLTIPFRYLNQYFPLDSGSANKYGYLLLRPYVAIDFGTAGSPTANYNIFISLENVKFMGIANYQSGLDKELSDGKGPISGPLGNITTGLRLFKNVPMLNYYTEPLSWVTDALGKTAKHFGFSAPTNKAGAMTIVNAPSFYNGHVDVPRPVQPLAATLANGIDPMADPSGCMVDEMSIDYLKQIMCYSGVIMTLSTSDAIGADLGTIYVNPCSLREDLLIASGTRTAHSWGPMGYIASRFQHWRGGIRYRFKLVKNAFHTGKILVAWVPYDGTGSTPSLPTIDSTYYAYREIIDISETNQFDFVVPYVSTKLYKSVANYVNVDSFTTYGTNVGLNGTDWVNGIVVVKVLEALRAPDACPQTVPVILEVAGEPDLQFMTPATEKVQSGTTVDVGPAPYYSGVFQSGVSAIPEFRAGGVNSFPDEVTTRVASMSGGEKIDSLRTLMKRYTNIADYTDTSIYAVCRPCTAKSFYQTAAGTVSGGGQYAMCDDIRYFGPLFAFFRGSIRYKYWLQADASGSTSIARNQYSALLVRNNALMSASTATANQAVAVGNATYIPNQLDAARPNVLAVSSLSEALEFSIPFYSTSNYWNTEFMFLDDTVTSTVANSLMFTGYPDVAAVVYLAQSTALTTHKKVERSLGDDASFSYFISTIPVIDEVFDGMPIIG